MPTLLLRLTGPMQSWGVTSRFDERDTGLEPSKSGVVGLLCAALGRDRSEPVADLASLRMGVRVDREGVLRRDFQTATGYVRASGQPARDKTVVSPRFYLADAVFLVGLEGRDRALLESLDAALAAPVWTLCLGRKGFPPGEPVRLPGGLLDEELEAALYCWPPLVRMTAEGCPVRFAWEDPAEGSMRMDQPAGPFSERSFGPRLVRSEVRHVASVQAGS